MASPGKKTKPTLKKKPPAKKLTNKKLSNKKPSTKKPRAKTKRKKQKSAFKKNIFVVFAVVLMITLVAFGYFLGKQNDVKTKQSAHVKAKNLYTSADLLKDLSKIKEDQPKETVHEVLRIQSPVVKESKKSNIKRSNAKAVKKHLAHEVIPVNRPKLVIIIDDISQAKQIAGMKATGLKLTPAIFPPSELSMTSHTLAKGLKHAMIHLPMQSGTKQFNKQYKTLFTSDSEAKIVQRVKELRKLFPHVHYVNNHTGSVFTNSYTAMYKLYEALREEDFTFVDSRTIGSTKVPQIASEFGDRYIARDIFIDNEHSIKAIHSQLRKAVHLAKKRGYAIAIGHPHKVTLQALSSSKEILKEVELVYIDSLYRH
ncbi:MAG: divergent polysaccharide deacetylase family protein [Sulfurovum sp.]|nr:divergent polysaccharide deacetylase family protein [Sulfurovum sp.]